MKKRTILALVLMGMLPLLFGACATMTARRAKSAPSLEVTRQVLGDAEQATDVAQIDTLDLPPSVAESTQQDIIETTGDTEGLPYWAIQPAHSELFFNGYALDGTFQEPRIYVYSVDALINLNPAAAEQVDALKAVLADPATTPDSGLPMLPLMNASQMFQAQVQTLDFDGGSGIRYLTQMGQGLAPLNNNEMFYTFQGLTDDGSVYVAAILPVSNPVLDTGEAAGANANLENQISNTGRALDEAGADSFTPSLSLLDSMVSSIQVR